MTWRLRNYFFILSDWNEEFIALQVNNSAMDLYLPISDCFWYVFCTDRPELIQNKTLF